MNSSSTLQHKIYRQNRYLVKTTSCGIFTSIFMLFRNNINSSSLLALQLIEVKLNNSRQYSYRRVGSGYLVLRHSAPEFSSYFRDIGCRVSDSTPRFVLSSERENEAYFSKRSCPKTILFDCKRDSCGFDFHFDVLIEIPFRCFGKRKLPEPENENIKY